jgi:thiamine-phosphate diphosphorylase
MTREAGRTFVVNDRLDVALRAGADGLHLGPDDMPVREARAKWPRPRLLGGSARTVERARRLADEGADYLGAGPVFGTSTKADAPGVLGLEALARIASSVDVPVIGIGGIDASNAAEVVRAGAAGVAVISSVVAADDVEEATRRLRDALDAARGKAPR